MNFVICLLASLLLTCQQPPILSLECKTKANPKDYLPTSIGTRWVYQNTYLCTLGASDSIVMVTWTSELSIIGISDLPEGELVAREMRIAGTKYNFPAHVSQEERLSFKQKFPESSATWYLIAGAYVFEVPQSALDRPKTALKDDFKKKLNEGKVLPSYFFPMDAVKMWSERKREMADFEAGERFKGGKGPAPNPVMYYWTNEGKEDLTVPFGQLIGVSHLAYRALDGRQDAWFKTGIGLVMESYRHSGSKIESESKLVSYFVPKPSQRKPQTQQFS